jgi:hypothetical protein
MGKIAMPEHDPKPPEKKHVLMGEPMPLMGDIAAPEPVKTK